MSERGGGRGMACLHIQKHKALPLHLETKTFEIHYITNDIFSSDKENNVLWHLLYILPSFRSPKHIIPS